MQRPRRKPWPLEAVGGPGGQGWPHRASDAALPASQLRGAPGRRPAPAQPRHPASTSGRAAGLVVGERVPQEDEDQDEAGGGQRGAGDVEEPGRLGIFHRPGQVVEQLLVPDLRPRRGVSCGADAGPPGGRREPPRPAPRPPTAPRAPRPVRERISRACRRSTRECACSVFGWQVPGEPQSVGSKASCGLRGGDPRACPHGAVSAGSACGVSTCVSAPAHVASPRTRGRGHLGRAAAYRAGLGGSPTSHGGGRAAHACPRLWVPPSLNELGVPDHGRCAGPGAGRPPGRWEGVPR